MAASKKLTEISKNNAYKDKRAFFDPTLRRFILAFILTKLAEKPYISKFGLFLGFKAIKGQVKKT